MSDGILVNHASLDAIIADMRAHVSAMRGRVDRLMCDLAPLHDEFEGEAKQAHAQVQTQVNQHFDQLGQILSAAATAVTNAQREYAAADAKGAQAFYDVSL